MNNLENNSKYYVGDRFEYQNYNKTKSEIIVIASMRRNEFVFESRFTPSMTLPATKIDDMIEKGKLKLINEKVTKDALNICFEALKKVFKNNPQAKP